MIYARAGYASRVRLEMRYGTCVKKCVNPPNSSQLSDSTAIAFTKCGRGNVIMDPQFFYALRPASPSDGSRAGQK